MKDFSNAVAPAAGRRVDLTDDSGCTALTVAALIFDSSGTMRP
jgi:hypothetical protein